MSYDGTLKFDVEIDTSDLEKELAKLQETISGVKFDSLFSSINEGVSQSSGIVSTLTDSVKTLGSGFEGVGKSLGSNLLGEVLKGGDAIGEFASKVTTNLSGIATSALATGGAMLAINAAVGLVSWGISALVEHFSKVDAETQKLRDEISGLAAEHESLNASIATTKETMDGNVTAAIANAEAAQTLVGQMREMAAAGDTGAGSQAKLCCVILWPVRYAAIQAA